MTTRIRNLSQSLRLKKLELEIPLVEVQAKFHPHLKVKGKKPGTSVDNEDFFDPHPSDSEDSSDKKKKFKRPDAFDLLPGLLHCAAKSYW